MISIKDKRVLEFDYVNYKGVESHRIVLVYEIYYGGNQYHPDLQWFMKALDINKKETRDFAMKDMKKVKVVA
jgi:predicted DNA-binding transcriptional regulator YafY